MERYYFNELLFEINQEFRYSVQVYAVIFVLLTFVGYFS
jgi:hypothetical protein